MKKESKIISDLGKGSEEKILEALAVAKEMGNEAVIPIVIQLATKHESPAVTFAAKDLLRSIKAKAFPATLVQAIDNAENENEKTVLIALCWECGHNFDAYLSYFVNLAISESYQNALEAITVVEEMSGKFDLKEVQQCIRDTEKAISEQPQKAMLLATLTAALKNFADPEQLN